MRKGKSERGEEESKRIGTMWWFVWTVGTEVALVAASATLPPLVPWPATLLPLPVWNYC